MTSEVLDVVSPQNPTSFVTRNLRIYNATSLREQATELPHITRNPRSIQRDATHCRLLPQALILFTEPTTGSQSLACGYLNSACIRRLISLFHGERDVEFEARSIRNAGIQSDQAGKLCVQATLQKSNPHQPIQ